MAAHSKIHCLADDQGRPVAVALTPGNVAEISMAIPLARVSVPSKRLIADTAYDATSLRNRLDIRRIETSFHSPPATLFRIRRTSRRNVIERLFCRLQHWRRLARNYTDVEENSDG